MECGQVSFIPFELFGFLRKGQPQTGHVRRLFTALFFCLDRITEAIQCNAGCSWSHYILERRVASNCMAVARDTRGQQRDYRWTGANSEHDEDDSPIHPRAETKAIAPIMPYDGCGLNQFG